MKLTASFFFGSLSVRFVLSNQCIVFRSLLSHLCFASWLIWDRLCFIYACFLLHFCNLSSCSLCRHQLYYAFCSLHRRRRFTYCLILYRQRIASYYQELIHCGLLSMDNPSIAHRYCTAYFKPLWFQGATLVGGGFHRSHLGISSR